VKTLQPIYVANNKTANIDKNILHLKKNSKFWVVVGCS